MNKKINFYRNFLKVFLDLHYDTDNGFEVFQFQLYSLSSIPPHQQKIFGAEQDTPVVNDSDLVAISDKLRLVSVNDSEPEPSAADLLKSNEELARLLQVEEEALMLQQYVASQNPREFDSRVWPYVSQVLMLQQYGLYFFAEYDIKCIIDFHVVLGSQNGMEHSASRDGFTG
ncbi:Peptide-N(4)-(N-acetyl-beta-glucosaminyl)asparagine amidase [Glycine soja]|uniref:Peptide-N(4)-(N-acetyl-beta-glucosaminyl)asparagine amidase n=1 Tax=Glycine soja TaxID=3848 RepID=A0A445FD88_GLYSO|nr:Peptide-N(4)-(N-acetyl-beta-glucosaminyl)asparagine amidase [Glycine soja]